MNRSNLTHPYNIHYHNASYTFSGTGFLDSSFRFGWKAFTLKTAAASVTKIHRGFLESADLENMPADNELSAILNRRQNLNEGIPVAKRTAKVSVYTEFNEFSRKQIQGLEDKFKT